MQDLTIPVITIDGGVATGKTSVAKLVAQQLRYHRLHSGLYYRGVGYLCDSANVTDLQEKILIARKMKLQINVEDRIFLNNEDITEKINSPHVGKLAKQIAQAPEIRTVFCEKFISEAKLPGLVAEGRDMGYRFETRDRYFLTVDPAVAVLRRPTETVESIIERDEEDARRPFEPFKRHPGAFVIDTSSLSAVGVMQQILNHREAKRLGLL